MSKGVIYKMAVSRCKRILVVVKEMLDNPVKLLTGGKDLEEVLLGL